jgi:hypothetical protein
VLEEQRQGGTEPIGAATQKRAEEESSGREKSTETGRESGYSVTQGSQPVSGSVYEGEGRKSTGTAGPTAQLSRFGD